MTEQYCDMCTAPMEEIKFIGTKESKQKYRQTWFKCPICGYEKKVYGSGYYSDIIVPQKAIRDAEKFFKQEENNRS